MDQKALFKISYGVYVVGAGNGKDINGQIANSIMQVTASPIQIAACINTQNYTHELIQKYRTFSLSVLEQTTPMTLIGDFGFKTGREFNKFKNYNFKQNETGAPILLDSTVAWMEVKVVSELAVGSHTIFVGEVVASELLNPGDPMTYAYYHLIKGGVSPKNAPTYNPSLTAASDLVEKDEYRCSICGYIYDPLAGDASSGVAPGTLFEDLPDDWVCPVCKAGKDKFMYS